MDEKTKKYLIWGAAGVALLGGGYLVYYYYMQNANTSATAATASTSSASSQPQSYSTISNGTGSSYIYSGLSPNSVAVSTAGGGTSESSPPSNPTYTIPNSSNNLGLNSFISQEIAQSNTAPAGNTNILSSSTKPFLATFKPTSFASLSNAELAAPSTPNLSTPLLQSQNINNPPTLLIGI